jgi:hypothetical protein
MQASCYLTIVEVVGHSWANPRGWPLTEELAMVTWRCLLVPELAHDRRSCSTQGADLRIIGSC